MVGIPGIAIGGAWFDEVAAARAAAHDPARGVAVVFICYPFPDVAGHIEQAKWARTLRVAADGHGFAGILARAWALVFEIAPVGAGAIGILAPGIFATIAAPRGLLPLVFAGQATASESTESTRLAPVDVGDGQIRLGRQIDGK